MTFTAPVRNGITSRAVKALMKDLAIPFSYLSRNQDTGKFVLELWEPEHRAAVAVTADELAQQITAAGFTVAYKADEYAKFTDGRRIGVFVTFTA